MTVSLPRPLLATLAGLERAVIETMRGRPSTPEQIAAE